MLQAHLEKLVAFKAIAEAGSIRKASQAIGIAQPALTRSMKVLEDAVGARLFRRSVRGIVLTDEGERLLCYSCTVLKGAADTQAQIQAAGDVIAGVLTVGTFASLSIYLWPKMLAHLRKVLPQLQIRLTTREKDHVGDLGKGLLDLVVDAEPRPHANMVSIPLYRDKFNFYVSSRQKNPGDDFIFVAKSYDEDDKTIADHFHACGYRDFSSPYELDSFETVKALTIQGVGVGILPERVAADALDKGQLKLTTIKPFPASGFGRHKICATMRADDRGDRRISALVKEMKLILS